MKIVADDKIPFLKGALEPFAELVYLPGSKTTPADVANADAIITRTRTKCNEKLLSGSAVKFIATATIGHDHIDTAYCDAKGIYWTNAPGCNSSSVAQYMTSVLLNLAVKYSISLKDRVLGVVGVGNVGAKVAKVGAALGMKVLLNDPPRAAKEGSAGFSSLADVIEKSDFITLHVPLYEVGPDKTFHMADSEFFSKLKKSQFFINASRGEVTDCAALKEALKSHKIKGAVLDVWENEPDIDGELLAALDIATPHIAGYSTDGKANGTSMSVNALAKFFGLKINNWFPADVPFPENTVCTVPEGLSFEEAMLETVSFSYDVMSDDRRLRASPETFEKQRGDYPLRREFHVFSAIGGNEYIKKSLAVLGFKTA